MDRLLRDVADLRHELHLLGLDSVTMSAKLDNLERDVTLIASSTAAPAGHDGALWRRGEGGLRHGRAGPDVVHGRDPRAGGALMPPEPHPLALRLFGFAAVVGILGWMALLALWGWWTLQPINLPNVTEPLPVLNPGHAVPIGEPLRMKLDVAKTDDLSPVASTRLLECESGNLVTLTSAPVQLPIGTYTITSDSIVIPAKITPGDTCLAVIAVTFRINPIRTEVARFESEPFLVLSPIEKG